ncbi:hypothetical protein K505DRAFT_328785 [Melanomma pulvis-pyrius CBS 109.77]|uniref:Uncharacterized protein n=1 Tax=Melanomma pulvis-pyrius CBS 109.77 TaxID=1314802 RepID=A0A6A6WWN9_9PLEO|nr:hypothetical protein K505DRAFT_328785 [Melanomma pulvis-pyrius CBS 109.77]
MTQVAPKRIVLKCPERHWKTQNEMLKAFFDSQGLELELLDKDIYTHILFEPSSPSHLFFVLDLYCKTIPDINLSQLELQIFQVSKNEPFTFRDLGDAGRKQAQPRSLDTRWGTDKRTGINQTN